MAKIYGYPDFGVYGTRRLLIPFFKAVLKPQILMAANPPMASEIIGLANVLNSFVPLIHKGVS